MENLVWNDKFSIGLPEIDEQHKKLIDIINMMNDVVEGKAMKNTTMKIVLREMVNYTNYHFNSEEELMIKSGYPGYAEHKKEHTDFIIAVKKFSVEIKENRNISCDLIIFLYNWLTNHILNVDNKMGQYTLGK